MKGVHLTLNFLLYLGCQILGNSSLKKLPISLTDQLVLIFVFSFMITRFYMTNNKKIKGVYKVGG